MTVHPHTNTRLVFFWTRRYLLHRTETRKYAGGRGVRKGGGMKSTAVAMHPQ